MKEPSKIYAQLLGSAAQGMLDSSFPDAHPSFLDEYSDDLAARAASVADALFEQVEAFERKQQKECGL